MDRPTLKSICVYILYIFIIKDRVHEIGLGVVRGDEERGGVLNMLKFIYRFLKILI